jgi:hypothetical protein
VQYCPVIVSSWASGEYSGDGDTCLVEEVTSWSTPFRDNAALQPGARHDGSYTDGVPFFALYPGVRVTYVAGLIPDYGTGDVAQMVVNACTCPRDKGDVDVDGDVDLDDYPLWGDCMTGPHTEWLEPGCQVFDFNGDGDVDLRDFAAFQRAFTG